MSPAAPSSRDVLFYNGRSISGEEIVARGALVSLRALGPHDVPHLRRWAADPFLARMVGSDLLYTIAGLPDARVPEACLADPTQLALVIEAAANPRGPLGLARLFNVRLLEGYGFLEVMITDRRALRKGYGIEAAKLICCYGADVLGLRRIEAKVYQYNHLSVNGLLRNGFRHEGTLRRAAVRDGREWDVLVFGILREEMDAQRLRDGLSVAIGEPGEPAP